MDLSVVIPVYYAAARLDALIGRLVPVLEQTGRSYEIVLVDDGSLDDTWKVMCRLRSTLGARLIVVRLMRNYGQHNALMAGFRRSRGKLVVTMDDDLQHPPEEIPILLASIEERDLDLVYGCYDVKKHSAWRNLGSTVVNVFFRLVFRLPVTVSAFRVIRRPLLESIFSYSLNFTYIDGLLAWNTQRIGQVTVEHHERAEGRSGYSLGKLMVLALNLFTNFSLLPLQLVFGCGLLSAAGGLGAALYYFIRYLRSDITVPGYASIIIAVLVLGGVQLLALGIMGEYLGRLHLNVNRKPQYVEREVLESTETKQRDAA